MQTEIDGIYEVELDAMAHGGEAVGSLADGRRVFVPGAIPGERARIRVRRLKKRWARAELLELLSTSPDRVEAPCRHAGECGGCQWQHIDIERQRRFKTEIVRGQLRHLGGMDEPPVEETRAVGSPDGFGYRNHVTLQIDEQGRPCYHRKGSRDLVPIESCQILDPLLDEWLQQMPPLREGRFLELRCGSNSGERLAQLGSRPADPALESAEALGIRLQPAGQAELHERIGDDEFRVSSKSFFQVNSEGARALSELVLELLEPAEGQLIADLYAGVGLFSVPLARRCGKLIAVESHAAALRDLRHHGRRHGFRVVAKTVEECDRDLPRRLDAIVADPPRVGLSPAAVELIAGREASRIVLASCDAANLAQDLRALCERGYRLLRSIPIDLFPHSYHVETVSLLLRDL